MRTPPELKPLFVERMKELLPEEKDYEEYTRILAVPPVRSIRCNTLKITPKKLKQRLEEKGWQMRQPWKGSPEVMIVDSDLEPGELGRSLEHLLGYYYIQELASMLPLIALRPQPEEWLLDMCAAPGSKTTQAAAMMKNTGTIIANEVAMGRMRILAANLERCGATNVVITKKDGVALAGKFQKEGFLFDKILLDAPCSGEGTLRSSPKTYTMWNINTVKKLSRIQEQLFNAAWKMLKVGGEMIYSTCTHAPEENERIVSWAKEKFGDAIEVEQVELPFTARPGITQWQDETYHKDVCKTCRVYPHDNDTEGFFVSKFRKVSE